MTMFAGFHFTEGDDRMILGTPGIRLVFDQRLGRWTHALEVREGYWDWRDEHRWSFPSEDSAAGPWVRVASAVEGGDDPRRVVSPVYQHFHWQPDVRGGCGMLIGQFGPHHFSAVFTALWGAHCDLDVEMADRCRAEVDALASTYRVDVPPGDLVEAETDRAAWRGPGHGRLGLATFGAERVTVTDAGPRATQAQVAASISPSHSTHRLSYRWSWER